MRRMRLNTSWPLLAVSLLLVLVTTPYSAFAQSGRRTPKGSPSPPPPAPTETTTPAPQPKTPTQPLINVLVVSDISQSIYLSIPFPEKVQTWVAKRLRDAASLSVLEGEAANRSEAVKRAKASTDTFVVFLRVDETGNNNTIGNGRSNIDDVSIGYTVFAPVTGKSQSSGVVYLNQRSTIIGIGRTGIPPSCYPGVRGNDLYMLQASLEVASRIMSALHVSASPPCS
jgi:hypothetical protein